MGTESRECVGSGIMVENVCDDGCEQESVVYSSSRVEVERVCYTPPTLTSYTR